MIGCNQGRRQKIFQGGGHRKKDRKIVKKTENSTIKPIPGEGRATEKRQKKYQKMTEK